MADNTRRVWVPLLHPQAFRVYVEEIDTWWPQQGVFPYTFAPSTTHPLHIRLEPGLGGHLHEEFADGTGYVVGRIVEWAPPDRLVYTWQDPTWEKPISIAVAFAAAGNGSEVTVTHHGFAAAGVPEMPPFYAIGEGQILAVFGAHCRALRELQALEKSRPG